MTELEYVGHATFALRHADASLVIDPCPPGAFSEALQLRPIDDVFDYWVGSHEHVDHNGGDALLGPPKRVPDGAGPFSIRRVTSDHDEYGGRRRGGQVDLLVIEVDDRRIVHASDIGRSPHPSTIDAIRGADVLLVPIGGFYTVGAAQAWEWCLRCSPKAIVPMHYKCGGGTLPLRGIDPFLAVATWPTEHRETLNLRDLPVRSSIIQMEPTHLVSHQKK